MNRSESIDQLATALALAQGKIRSAIKDTANPYFKSRYADLASIWDAVREPLSSNGLAVLQLPCADGPRVSVTTLLTHSSGQWISSELTMTAKEDAPQAIGSAITYARRYGLQSIAGVAPDDDDGESAQGRAGQWQQQKAAAAQVAERKIKDLSQPRVEPDQPPQHAAGSIKQRLEAFKKMKEALGDEPYYQILGSNGYCHANEIESIARAREIYSEMQQQYDDQVKSRSVA